MKRRFYINMYIKGKIERQLQSNINLVNFYKTDKKQIQIIEFNENLIKEYFKYNYETCFLSALGINKNNPYKDRGLMREILKEDIKKGYKAIKINEILKQSEKAYFIKGLNTWLPKSQCIIENNILYIKEWLFFKNLF